MTETLVVVSFLVEKNGKVLIVQEAEDDIKGKWCFPGGKLKQGETINQAAERELREETGLKLITMSMIRIYEGVRDGKLGVRIHLAATVEEVGNSKLESDILNVTWVTKDELRRLFESGQTRPGIYHASEIKDFLDSRANDGSIITLESG